MSDSKPEQDIHVLVGNKIKAIRKEKGIRAEQLANDSGLSESYISRLENGKQSPTLSTLEKLAKAMDVPVIAFFSFL